MKRTLSATLLFTAMLTLSGCSSNIKDVKIIDVDSEIYSESEINSAIDTVKEYFKSNFEGCTLTMLKYAGDDRNEASDIWAKRHDAEKAIILLSSFDVDSSGGDGSLNPDSTYKDWNWILVENENGKWEHVDHGYWFHKEGD